MFDDAEAPHTLKQRAATLLRAGQAAFKGIDERHHGAVLEALSGMCEDYLSVGKVSCLRECLNRHQGKKREFGQHILHDAVLRGLQTALGEIDKSQGRI